jgi:hypothetical protein
MNSKLKHQQPADVKPAPWIVRKWRNRRYILGTLLQVLRAPGFVQPGEYEALGCRIAVRCSRYFTIITVKGVDYYFYRGSGGFDGTGFDPNVVQTTTSERLINSFKDAS